MDTAEQLRLIKSSLRGLMNGPVSQSMRQKGLTYKVNFGVEWPRLVAMAQTLPHNSLLAQALWQEDIRECRLLAAMLQPADDFPPQLADLWVESMRFTEEVECTVRSLFSRLPYASAKAFEWMARPEPIFQQCGFQLAGVLFAQGASPNLRDRDEFLDQAAAALKSPSRAVAMAARRALLRFMELDDACAARAEELLES